MIKPVKTLLVMVCVVTCLYAPGVLASALFSAPQPGDVYKEFTVTMNAQNAWRITDPDASNKGSPGNSPGDFLPNPELNLSIDDLQGAVRAEVVIDAWGGHTGTTGKRFRFNGKSWLNVPELSTTPGRGECYTQQVNYAIDVPLSHLKQGFNVLQGDSGGQTCYNFNWGQWGWYTATVRVYYNSSKAHPTGSITSHNSGQTFGENPAVTASANSSKGIERVEFYAFYDGYDTDGDGVYADYQRSYHRAKKETVMVPDNHVGTATGSPYRVTWDTSLVPDQPNGGVKLIARILDKSGVWFVTNEIKNLTLQRSGSVKLYKPKNVPEKFWVRNKQKKSSTVTIPSGDNLSKATYAKLLVRTWNGVSGAEDPGDVHYTKVNGNWSAPRYGKNHFYSYDELDIPPSKLKNGENTIEFYAESVHHGIEIMWPGPAILVGYSTGGGNPPPSPTPPSINTQPQDQTVAEGSSATFSVSASGTALDYQWQRDGLNIAGATNASYTTPVTTLADSGATFQVVVSNSEGTVTSRSALLTVNSGTPGVPLAITSQPSDQLVGTGATATFTVVAEGTGPLSYQWKKNTGSGFSNITGAIGASYVTPAAAASDDGTTFKVKVFDTNGNVTSDVATLSVTAGSPGDAPSITTAPSDQTVDEGDTATFSVVADGTAPLGYQWKKGGTNIPGATGSSYTTPATTAADDGGTYTVVVSNAVGSVTSNAATLTVTIGAVAPSIISQPSDQMVTEGDTATFSVVAQGTGPLSYQWRKNTGSGFVEIPGATGTSYTTPATTLGDDGTTFKVKVTNSAGDVASNVVALSVTTDVVAPSLVNGPSDQTVVVGDSASFSVVANGTVPFTYQWQKNGIDIAGATSDTYTTPVTSAADDASTYQVVVANSAGSVTSPSATLTVVSTPADSNGDGLSDADATRLGLDPNDADGDTDNDGSGDVDEVGGDVNNPLDSDADGVIDALEPSGSAIDGGTASGLPTGNGDSVTIMSVGETLSNVSTGEVDEDKKPAGIQFPFGTLSYTTTAPLAGSVSVQMEFSSDLPADMVLYKVDNNGDVSELPSSVWVRLDSRTVEMILTDGDPQTDLDGLVNGSIDDPVAPAAVPSSAGGVTSSGGGGGGCALNQSSEKRDPVLPLLVLMMLAQLLRKGFFRSGKGVVH